MDNLNEWGQLCVDLCFYAEAQEAPSFFIGRESSEVRVSRIQRLRKHCYMNENALLYMFCSIVRNAAFPHRRLGIWEKVLAGKRNTICFPCLLVAVLFKGPRRKRKLLQTRLKSWNLLEEHHLRSAFQGLFAFHLTVQGIPVVIVSPKWTFFWYYLLIEGQKIERLLSAQAKLQSRAGTLCGPAVIVGRCSERSLKVWMLRAKTWDKNEKKK